MPDSCPCDILPTFLHQECAQNITRLVPNLGTAQPARMVMLRPGGGTGGRRDGWRETDGWTVTKVRSDGL